MNQRQQALEHRRLELAARIDLQRLKWRLQVKVAAARQPWLILGATQGWRRHLLIAGVLGLGTAAVAVRRQALASASPVWRMAQLGARCWVAGKLGWELARQWRRAQRRPTVDQGTPS
jgi:hypothetical protein